MERESGRTGRITILDYGSELAILAIGINASSSRLNGLNPAFIKFLSFVLLGLCVAVVGLIKVSRLSSINDSVIAKDIEMNAIASSIIGGTLLTGGVGNMIGTFFGVLSLSIIQNIVSSAGLDQAWWTGITIAAMLCIFLVVQSVIIARKKKAEA